MNHRILLIEDNENNRYLVTYLLEQRGHLVLHAGDGLQGIEMAARHMPDIIILDIQLPGMDGYGVARALKADSRLRMIPIVAVTSYAMTGDRQQALDAGCDSYLEKPIDPDTFAQEVERALTSRAGGSAS